ncbi:transcription elongation factor [Telluribacter sp.]|jgi:transcription elongation GreA/GreB family factor|uniref:transcription elongation factor n=1 Tax=Telluribacter sp. TaxID=1978767 RepID=UPI002E119280|nr:transcription elongation factor [Telluribacter sp.]
MKQQLITHLKTQLDERMAVSWQAMEAAQASANEQSKSSVGDKYETARAMGQLDRDMYARQYEQARQERQVLNRINETEVLTRVALGSLVRTTAGPFFVAVSVGPVTLEGTTVMAVSLASPIGRLLMGKGVGESFQFQGKTHKIEAIE